MIINHDRLNRNEPPLTRTEYLLLFPIRGPRPLPEPSPTQNRVPLGHHATPSDTPPSHAHTVATVTDLPANHNEANVSTPTVSPTTTPAMAAVSPTLSTTILEWAKRLYANRMGTATTTPPIPTTDAPGCSCLLMEIGFPGYVCPAHPTNDDPTAPQRPPKTTRLPTPGREACPPRAEARRASTPKWATMIACAIVLMATLPAATAATTMESNIGHAGVPDTHSSVSTMSLTALATTLGLTAVLAAIFWARTQRENHSPHAPQPSTTRDATTIHHHHHDATTHHHHHHHDHHPKHHNEQLTTTANPTATTARASPQIIQSSNPHSYFTASGRPHISTSSTPDTTSTTPSNPFRDDTLPPQEDPDASHRLPDHIPRVLHTRPNDRENTHPNPPATAPTPRNYRRTPPDSPPARPLRNTARNSDCPFCGITINRPYHRFLPDRCAVSGARKDLVLRGYSPCRILQGDTRPENVALVRDATALMYINTVKVTNGFRPLSLRRFRANGSQWAATTHTQIAPPTAPTRTTDHNYARGVPTRVGSHSTPDAQNSQQTHNNQPIPVASPAPPNVRYRPAPQAVQAPRRRPRSSTIPLHIWLATAMMCVFSLASPATALTSTSIVSDAPASPSHFFILPSTSVEPQPLRPLLGGWLLPRGSVLSQVPSRMLHYGH
ncbi:hypothetical protein CYMTET_47198 [Cymbomonas tetramitiformis]|uniref:Uncharacterized protein n=1 Tax=Cymbomonas tetramitiformis TaxID=36881 RepID=A0AAE0EWE9_9CHLO|nr:hypothetical protein CYMTET_47198 [Cymbomonas tetramitiformis]